MSAPILQNLTGLTFLMQAETGVIVSAFNRNTAREWSFVYDHSVGYETGFAAFNPSATYTCNGKTSGATGVAAAAPGIAITFANTTTGNGVTAGTIFTETAALNHAEKGFEEINVTAFQKPGIVAA